jgi:hypothetical protein
MTVNFNEPIKHARKASYTYRQNFAMIPCAEQIVFHDDFCQDVASNLPTGWDAVIIDTGATITQAAADGFEGGVIKITSDGTTEGAATYLPKQIQLSDQRFFMEVRFQTEDADDTDFQFGLTDLTATTNPEDLWTTASADLIAFGILDGDATPQMLCDKDNSGSTAEAASGTDFDVADATWHTMAILVEGNSTDGNMTVRGYIDGDLAVTWSTETEIPDDVILAPFIGARTGADANHDVYVDYVRFAFERT